MDFQEAEARFWQLENQLARGQLSEQQYRMAVNQLRVQDEYGRLWMLQEETGAWYVWDEEQWLPATPPSHAVKGSPRPAVVAPRAAPAREKGGGSAKMVLRLIGWAVLWAIIGAAVYYFFAEEYPEALLGVGVASLISLVFMLVTLSSHWEGQIVDIRTERVRVDDGEDWHYEKQTFAIIRRSSGRTKKVRAHRGWQVGDYLVKRRGESRIRKS